MEFIEPWFATSYSRIVDELHRETPTGHVLEGIELLAIAYRRDCDEVFYAPNDGSGRLAAVHLKFFETSDTSPTGPRTWIFENLEQWLEYMRAAHAAWVEEDSDGQLWLKRQRLWDAARRF